MNKKVPLRVVPSIEYPGIVEMMLYDEVISRQILVPATVPPGEPARIRAVELLYSELYKREKAWAEFDLIDYGGEGAESEG
jgi:hypothetical protein